MLVDFVDVPKETNNSAFCYSVGSATVFRADVYDGHVTHKVVAEALQLPYVPAEPWKADSLATGRPAKRAIQGEVVAWMKRKKSFRG